VLAEPLETVNPGGLAHFVPRELRNRL
jgi:hypothetical protein